MKKHLIILILSSTLAVIFSDFTEEFLYRPSAMFMTFVSLGRLNSISLDQKGIPSVYSNRQHSLDYNPVTTSLYALSYYEKFKKTKNEYNEYIEELNSLSDREYLNYFFNCADWLVDQLKIYKYKNINYGVWEYNQRRPIYNLDTPWVSALAQGLGIQVLGRAFVLTNNKKYLKSSETALNAFFVKVNNGGVTYMDDNNNWWYEEYAHPTGKVSRALNGMQLVLIGFFEYYSISGNQKSKLLFDKGISGLKTNIQKYDAGWRTYYDILGTIANKDYHKLHISLLKKIFIITKDPFFEKIAEKWSNYHEHYFIREFIKQKPNYHNITIMSFNVIGFFVISEIVFSLYAVCLKKVFKNELI